MRRALVGFCWLASLWAVVPAHAQQAVKVGLIMAYSGQFTDAAAQMDNGVKLYMKQHSDTVAGRPRATIAERSSTMPPLTSRLPPSVRLSNSSMTKKGLPAAPSSTARNRGDGSPPIARRAIATTCSIGSGSSTSCRVGQVAKRRSLTAWSGISRPQSDQAMAAKLIRALLAGRAAGDVITVHDE